MLLTFVSFFIYFTVKPWINFVYYFPIFIIEIDFLIRRLFQPIHNASRLARSENKNINKSTLHFFLRDTRACLLKLLWSRVIDFGKQ